MKKLQKVVSEAVEFHMQESIFLADNSDMITNGCMSTNIVGEIGRL